MRKATGIALLVLFCVTLLVGLELASADVPKLITIQGRLRNATTQAVLSGDFNITFRIYTTSTGGSAIYTEEHRGASNVSVNSEGIFQTILGSITTLDLPFDQAYFLELNITNEVLSPRNSITSSAYSFRANTSTNVECTDCVDFEDRNCANVTTSVDEGTTVGINATTQCKDLEGCDIYARFTDAVFIGGVPTFSAGWGHYFRHPNGTFSEPWVFQGFNTLGETIFTSGANGNAVGTKVFNTPHCVITDDGTPSLDPDSGSFILYRNSTGTGASDTCSFFFCD